MAYDSKIRGTAQAFMLAGYRLTDVHDQLEEIFGIDVPTSTLSLWKSNIPDDEQISKEAEEYRKKHADLCWYNIKQANELLGKNLHSALMDRERIDAVIAHLSELEAREMFDEVHMSKVQEAIDLLTECRQLTSTKDALKVVTDLGAQRDRAASLAAGSFSGELQITFSDEMEELSV